MSFQAKKLRVQLSSGESLIFDEEAAVAGAIEPAHPADDKVIKPVCIDDLSTVYGSCIDFFTQAILLKSADVSLLRPDQLSVVRERLEAQLREIAAAEQGLSDQA